MKTTNRGISYIPGRMLEFFSTLTGGSERDFEEKRRRSVLAFFLMMGIVITLPFAIHHFTLGNMARAILLLFVGSVQFTSLVALYYLRQSNIILRLNVILLGAYLLFLIIVGGTHGSRLLWAFIFPLFSFFLLGKKEGLFWSTLLLLFSLIVFMDPANLFGTFPYEKELKARFLISYAVILLLSFIVEATRQKYQAGMELIRLELEERVEQRTSELRNTNEKLKKEISDRKSAQQELLSSERRLSDIINFLPDATFVIDLEGKVIAWNHTVEELTGIKAEEILGRGDYEYAIPFYGHKRPVMIDLTLHWDEEWAKKYEYVKRVGTTLVSETRDPKFRKDPSLFWNTACPLYDIEGNIFGSIEVIRDITDYMLAEEALKAEKQEKELILRSLMEHVIYEDRDMKILWANRAACESADMSHDELIGRHCYEIWPQRKDPCPDCPVRSSIEKGEPQEVEKTTPDGRTWLIRGYPVRDAHEEIVGGIEVTLEITERKKAEAALNEAYNILRASPAVAFLWRNQEGWPVEFVTDNVEDLFGYSAKDFVSGELLYSQTIHQDDLERVAGEVSSYSGKERFDRFMHEPYRILTKQGQAKWLEDRTHIRRDSEGRVTHYQGILMDITARVQAQDALKESEERFRTLVEKSPLGISLIGNDGRYMYVNPKFEEIFGYGIEDIPTGRKWMEKAYPDPELRREVITMWKQDFQEPKAGEVETHSFRVTCKDGSEKDTTFRPMKLETGDVIVIYEDTTERKRLEALLSQAQKMEAIGTLAGGIAHDFNNLLMGIQGRASLMLVDMDASNPHFEHLRGIEEYVRSSADLTKQLLGFARGGKYEVKVTDLNDLADRNASLFGRTRKEITIHRKFESNLWTIRVDWRQIEQVLLNLFVNAWQAMTAGGEIYLQTSNVLLNEAYVRPHDVKSGKYVKLSVTDTGVGMDEQTKQRLFDPFFTTKDMGRGTGLGLASVYGIIKNHDGIITVYSEKGHGSTFNVYLPASGENVSQETEIPDDFVKGKGTILLVDDEKLILDVGKPMLEEGGYKVLVAGSGKEAIELYKSNMDRIDMVILDMIMPQMSGGETFDQLKGINPHVKVLLSSGYSINGEAQEILNRGCQGFIQKPFNLTELSLRVREILSAR